jgi:NADH-quinone oxidoreductase subunit N
LTVIKAIVDVGLISVAVVAVLTSVIGAFYYLRIIKVMYFDQPEVTRDIVAPGSMQIMLTVNALWVLALGIFPSSLLTICSVVMQ